MDKGPSQVQAHLVSGTEKVPIEVRFNSRYSLLVRCSNGDALHGASKNWKLLFPMNGEHVELGPCCLSPSVNIEGYAGQLIFTGDVFDLERLFYRNEVITLQNNCLNLPLVLNHKNDIDQTFKNYTSDLTYDLSVFKNQFDSLDAEYAGEPEHVRNAVQNAIIKTEGARFMRYLDERLMDFQGILQTFSKEQHQTHGFYFRRQLWSFILCSEFMKRTNLKPRGYSGDSQMMKMIYANDYQGESTFSKLLDKHPLEHPAAQAVRNRRGLIARRVSHITDNSPAAPDERLKVLSVACGPAFELKDVLLTPEDCERFHFTLLDQDRGALFEAAELIHEIESSLKTKVHADYLNESVRTMLATPHLKNKWGQFHFIYSMGLFDYLTPPVAAAVLSKLYQLLKPGGELVIGNFHISNPSRYYMEYWLDWVLYYRSEDDFYNLLRDAPDAEIEVSFEDTGVQMFLRIKKKRES